MAEITGVWARQILDSRANPTIEVDVFLDDGTFGRCAVPSGASTGKREAIELRDEHESVYHGKGVREAVENVNETIAPELTGLLSLDQEKVDRTLIELDGTDNKSELGANAILGCSLATARAGSEFLQLPLFRHLGGALSNRLPVPQMNVINGGAHASNNLVMQEFMIVPHGFPDYSTALQAGVETYHSLRSLLIEMGEETSLGDEGGFAPDLDNHKAVLELLIEAVESAGYKPGDEISLAIDAAAGEFFVDEKYNLEKVDRGRITTGELLTLYEEWVQDYPIVSIEDGFSEDDYDGWKQMKIQLGDQVQIVGDDLFVTNPEIIRRGIQEDWANSVLIKPNQIGTLTETVEAIKLAGEAGYRTVVSHRSGETSDTTIADLAVGLNCSQIKTGSPARSERTAKYNRLLRIEEMLEESASFAGDDLF